MNLGLVVRASLSLVAVGALVMVGVEPSSAARSAAAGAWHKEQKDLVSPDKGAKARIIRWTRKNGKTHEVKYQGWLWDTNIHDKRDTMVVDSTSVNGKYGITALRFEDVNGFGDAEEFHSRSVVKAKKVVFRVCTDPAVGDAAKSCSGAW